MKLLKITRDEEFVRIRSITDDAIMAREEVEVTAHEAPLKAFDDALQELGPIAANILELGKGYCDGMIVRSLRIKRTKSGTRSVAIGFEKKLNAVDNPHRLTTPLFNIDAPSDNEQGTRECSTKETEVIDDFLTQAEEYAKGERQQRLLPLVEADPAEGESLPGTEDV